MISDTSYGSIFKNCNFKEVHTSQECNGAMLYTEDYELRNIKSIYTAFIHHLAWHCVIILWGLQGSKILYYIEGFLGTIHVLYIMQRSIIIYRKCIRQCMQMLWNSSQLDCFQFFYLIT